MPSRRTAFAILVWAAPSPSHASGLDAPQIGSAQSGPVSNDAAAVWWNPGCLGHLKQAELLLGVGLVFGSVGYQRELRGHYQYSDNLDFAEPVPTSDLDPTKTGKQQTVHDVPLGPALDLFLALPALGDRVAAGAGLSLPYVASVSFPSAGPQRFAGESLFLAVPHTSAALAFRLTDSLSIGASVSYVFGSMSFSKTQDFGALDSFGDALSRPPIAQANDFGGSAPASVRELDVLARPLEIHAAGAHAVSFHVGAALQPSEKLALGLVYHHGTQLRFHGKFRLDMNDEFFTQDLASQGLEYDPIVSGKSLIHLRLPRRMTLGASYQLARRFALDGFASYVFYQDLSKLAIRLDSAGLARAALGIGNTVEQDLARNWQGVVIAELSARMQATDALRVSFSVGYQTPASPDATIDVISLDGQRIILGGGLAYHFSERAALLADLEGQLMLPRQVRSSDYDLGNGTYGLLLGAFTLHGQFLFGARRATPTARGN
jgi:long-chain fatty acid transport protein